MKSTSYMFPAAGVSTLGLLVALAGCANTPTRLATTETDSSPALGMSVNGHHEAPEPVNRVAPQYPLELRRSGTTGTVDVVAWIDHTGHVRDAKVENFHNWALATAALNAVKQWTFQPALRDGVPVAERVTIPIEFSLTE